MTVSTRDVVVVATPSTVVVDVDEIALKALAIRSVEKTREASSPSVAVLRLKSRTCVLSVTPVWATAAAAVVSDLTAIDSPDPSSPPSNSTV